MAGQYDLWDTIYSSVGRAHRTFQSRSGVDAQLIRAVTYIWAYNREMSAVAHSEKDSMLPTILLMAAPHINVLVTFP